MRIVVDARTILNPRGGEAAGVGHYTSAILRHIAKIAPHNAEFIFFVRDIAGADNIEQLEFRNMRVRVCASRVPLFSSHFVFARQLMRERADVVFFPSGQIPLGFSGHSVITIHDLAIYKNPKWFPDSAFGRWFSAKIVVPLSISRATRIICVSESTKVDLLSIFGSRAKGKARVVYEGADLTGQSIQQLTDETRKKFRIINNYICTICTIEPRKNIAIAVRAFGSFLRANPQYAQSLQYIIAGKNGWKSEDVFLAIDEVNKEFSDSVRYVGYLSEHEKWQILVNAKAFLFPTKYEGFGLPVLEAMSVGTPVISTNISSIPEIGADAILYSDPDSEASIADQIQRIVYDSALASELSKKAKEQAKFFSWQKAAKQTLDVLNEAKSLDKYAQTLV